MKQIVGVKDDTSFEIAEESHRQLMIAIDHLYVWSEKMEDASLRGAIDMVLPFLSSSADQLGAMLQGSASPQQITHTVDQLEKIAQALLVSNQSARLH